MKVGVYYRHRGDTDDVLLVAKRRDEMILVQWFDDEGACSAEDWRAEDVFDSAHKNGVLDQWPFPPTTDLEERVDD